MMVHDFLKMGLDLKVYPKIIPFLMELLVICPKIGQIIQK